MPKSKPPRKKHRPANRTKTPGRPTVPARWGDLSIQHYYDQIFAAIQNDDAISAEWATRNLLDALRPHVDNDVSRARRDGATWAQIGEGLGISGQAAGKRYAHLRAGSTAGTRPRVP